MVQQNLHQSSFISGELSSDLLGRGDLVAYEQGAKTLENVFVKPTGGIERRAGLKHVDTLSGDGRLATFEQSTDQLFLLVFRDGEVDIYHDDALVATLAGAPWALADLGQLWWVQNTEQLLVLHPDHAPKRIYKDSTDTWVLNDWQYVERASVAILQPYHKFADDDVTLSAGATTGSGVSLTASDDVFDALHVGTRFRLGDKEVEITAVASATVATITIKETLTGTSATADWKEQVFSAVRGWPVSACFHQDRLVIGGARSAPNRLWFSKTGDQFNFDPGSALDDEAIAFAMLSDQQNAVRAVFSGRHLQVFTSGAEWMVTGEPLTPSNIQVKRQTRVGSTTGRALRPADIDGATLFISRSGNELREFLFTDIEQAYQASDLALLSAHLMQGPRDVDFDARGRRLLIAMDDGSLAALTLYRAEKVAAWTRQITDGNFRSISALGDDVYALVERAGEHFLERLDASINTDCATLQTQGTATDTWTGLDHLEGKTVKIVADGVPRPDLVVVDGALTLSVPAITLEAGLAYAHIVEPLPPAVKSSAYSQQSGKARPLAMTFRLSDTAALTLDTGRGPVSVPFKRFGTGVMDQPFTPFSGDKKIRAFGWQAGGTCSLWRIEQDIPLPFTLLAVVSEISING